MNKPLFGVPSEDGFNRLGGLCCVNVVDLADWQGHAGRQALTLLLGDWRGPCA
jgi:hypothetical protein